MRGIEKCAACVRSQKQGNYAAVDKVQKTKHVNVYKAFKGNESFKY